MSKPRTVYLFCPSVLKLTQLAAWDEQRLDVGSMARAFELDPSTVKLNGHFISRGLDFVSVSVTWRSLLNFFSAKGLPTGIDHKNPLIVDGKLCKLGSKRSPMASSLSSSEATNLLKGKKLKDGSSGCKEGDHCVSMSHGISLKRKQSVEDLCSFKKLRINESNSDCGGTASTHCGSTSRTQFTCSYLNDSLKRPREHEVITATPCKRVR